MINVVSRHFDMNKEISSVVLVATVDIQLRGVEVPRYFLISDVVKVLGSFFFLLSPKTNVASYRMYFCFRQYYRFLLDFYKEVSKRL